MKPRAIAILLLLGTLTACSGVQNLPPIEENGRPRAYQLGSGDQLRVIVYGEDLPEEYAVSDAGTISIPLVGTIEARGQSTTQLEGSIASALKTNGIIRVPRVSVAVLSYRPFYILGEVEEPGQYPYQTDMTVLTAAAVGGGFTSRANTKIMSITRTLDGRGKEWRANRSTLVRPGDVIFVHERFF